MKEIRLVKNRSDIGAGTRGSDLGIDAIEIAAINNNNNFFIDHDYVDVATHNESIYNKVNAKFAKRIQFVLEQCTRVCETVHQVLEDNCLPIVLSGDHSSALGTISGIKSKFKTKQVGVIWIDAHADLHSPYTTPSGNVHGMPLAAALGQDNVEHKINDVNEETEAVWQAMKNIGINETKLKPAHLIFFGVRDTEAPEDHQIEKLNIKNYTVAEMRFRGFEICLKEAVAKLEDCDVIYISFDVDSMDCDLVSNGTGTPVSKGFDPNEVIKIINAFLDTKKVQCIELTEINPLLDTKGNKMAETAFYVLDSVTDYYIKNCST